MAFDFNWAPQKLPLQMINGRSRAAADNMAGYVPNEGNPEVLGNEILAENAVDNMKGYNPNLQEQRYVGRTPQQFNNAGQGQGYTFNDPEFTQYMQEQQQAEQQAAQREQRISDIQSQIAELEKRIADNTSKLQNFVGSADQIAAIEARKINGADPTSIWRWKEGMNQQRINRLEDLERIEKEKKLTDDKNLELNRYKIDNILQSTLANPSMTRDKLELAIKQLNDAEELAKQYKDTDSLKKINERKNELGIYVPVDDEANILESDFIKNREMVGKQGGKSKEEFAKYVQELLDDPKNKHIWHYSPELQQQLYAAIGKNTKGKPTNYGGY